jgi:hypothetical protein
VYFDNFRTFGTIGNSHTHLLKLTTTPVWRGRVLGVSKNFEGPAGMVKVMTGNGLGFAGDMRSRVAEIHLSSDKIDNVATRKFKHPDLAKWTWDQRRSILGALVCIMRQGNKNIKETSGRFPAFSRVVVAPVLDAAGLKPEKFFQPWVEAGADDAAGTVSEGLDTVLHGMALMQPRDKMQPVEGDWLTATEIMDKLRQDVLDATHSEEITPKKLSDFLQKRRGQNVTYIKRKLTLRSDMGNLGDRTGRKDRRVFRVERDSAEPVKALNFDGKAEKSAEVLEIKPNKQKD